jgi:azobenzene reductase
MKIVMITGSNRKEATSTVLAKALEGQLRRLFVEVNLFNLYESPLPFYSPDEIFNRHEGVRELQRLLMEADGIILTTPEYHGGMSGVLKNALDHMGQMHFSGLAGSIRKLGGRRSRCEFTAANAGYHSQSAWN